MKNPTHGGRRGRHRRRWTATAVLLGAPLAVVPYLLFVQEDSQAATVDGHAYYELVSVRSGKVLDVNGFSTADGTRIQQWTDQRTANQQWKLKPMGDGYYELVNRNSGKVLGIAGSSTAQAAAAEQQTDTSSTSQEWRIDDVSGSGAVTFTSRRSGQVLDVSGGSTAQGAAIIQYPSRGSTNQQWKLVKTAEPQTAGTGGAQTTAAAGPYVWKNAQVVGGGYVTGLVFNQKEKGLLYARTDMGGAYRWDTAAEQWIPLTDWLGEKDWNLLGIDALATDPVDPGRLYLATGTYTNEWAGNGAILRSTDRGRTFQRTDLPFKLGGNEPGRGAGERLVIDPADHGTLLLGTRKNGLWRSTDYGATWSQVSSFPVKDGASSGAGISFVTYGPAGSNTVYVGVNDKSASLYRSTDGGSSWQAVSGQPTGQMPQHGVVTGDGSLYLTYSNSIGPMDATAGSVWKYTPAGGAWKNVSPSQGGYGFSGLAVDPQKPSTVMVTTLDRWWPQDELYRTTDGGATWKALADKSVRDASAAPYVGTGIGHWMTALAIDPFDSGHVLYGTGNGIWRSKDAGASDSGGTSHWTSGAVGLEETSLADAIAPPGGATLITSMGDQGGFRYGGSLTEEPAEHVDQHGGDGAVFSSASGGPVVEQFAGGQAQGLGVAVLGAGMGEACAFECPGCLSELPACVGGAGHGESVEDLAGGGDASGRRAVTVLVEGAQGEPGGVVAERRAVAAADGLCPLPSVPWFAVCWCASARVVVKRSRMRGSDRSDGVTRKTYLDWKLDDPAGQGVDAVRPIRDEIEHRIRALLADLGAQAGA
ncbi:RICIN domain-containing protein [Streptomyces sp. NPDC004237]|uniref:RICIN domain-containing protein n=1 Tax=Streptomyces sp. NPDC004237 TaxID=3154455 RepID=UPI0033B2C2E0